MPLKDLPEEQKNAALDWIESLPNHPEVGHEIKKLLKKANPNIQYPELDIEERLSAKTKADSERIDKFLESQKEKENKAYWAEKTKAVKERGHVRDDEVDDFHKWMVDEHIGNYDLAAKEWDAIKHTAAEPTNYQDVTGVQLPSHEGLFQNPQRWSRDEAMKYFNERNRANRNRPY